MHPLAAQSVTQGYGSDEPLQRGMLVALKTDDPEKVEAVKVDTLNRLFGVVVEPNDSAVTLSSEDRKNFVATGGNFEVLVSDQNGPIRENDYISISSLGGIAMKATEDQAIVLGKAIGDFDGRTGIIGSTIDEKTKQTVNFGRVQVAVSINRNPLLKTPDENKLPKFLNRISENVAQKPVSQARAYLALVMLIVAAIIAGVMLFSGTRSSLISIGRNPLSKKGIIKGLIQVVLLSLIVFITGIFGVYLLLKL